MALEITLSGGSSAAPVLENLGIPNPHTWTAFTESQEGKVLEVLEAYGAHVDAGGLIEVQPDAGVGQEPPLPAGPPLTPAPPPSLPSEIDFDQVLVPAPMPPKKDGAAGSGSGQGGSKKVDHQKKAKKQDEVGKLGEKFALEYERWRLRNHPELKKKISHVSLDDDTFGYDIHSFEEDGADRFVEAKGTLGPMETRFFLSATELACAEVKGEQYVILRVAQLAHDPKCCEIRYPFDGKLELTPATYSVGFVAEPAAGA